MEIVDGDFFLRVLGGFAVNELVVALFVLKELLQAIDGAVLE